MQILTNLDKRTPHMKRLYNPNRGIANQDSASPSSTPSCDTRQHDLFRCSSSTPPSLLPRAFFTHGAQEGRTHGAGARLDRRPAQAEAIGLGRGWLGKVWL